MEHHAGLDTFAHCNIISRASHFNKLLHQIELAFKSRNLVLINETLLANLSQGDATHRWDTDDLASHLRQLIARLIQIYDQNYDSHLLWLTHKIASAILELGNSRTDLFNQQQSSSIELITDSQYTQLILICSNQLVHSVLKCQAVINLYESLVAHKVTEKDEHFQEVLINLKNCLFQCSVPVSSVINIFSEKFNQLNALDPARLNLFDKIYMQALIHMLKNDNKPAMIEILLRCPDSVLQNDNLLCQIIEYFLFQNHHLDTLAIDVNLFRLYSSCLYRFTPHLIASIYSIRLSNPKYSSNFFNSDSQHFFLPKECFLLAVHEKKHFLNQFRTVYCTNKSTLDISHLPVKSQLIIILISLHDLMSSNQNDINMFIDKMARFESNVTKLLLQYECDSLHSSNSDRTFCRIVDKLNFVLHFADWCNSHINYANVERNAFCYNIIASLLSGNSPLKILSNNGFLEFKPKNGVAFVGNRDKTHIDELCTLIQKFDHTEAMTLKGFIVLRTILSCILTKEDENVFFDTNQVKGLVQDIMPIDFRVEILENMFSLLFLTKSDFNHHLNLNSSEDEDYLDETLSSSRPSAYQDDTSKQVRKRLLSDLTKTTFLCPNWIIPKILDVLKEILYKTSSEMYSMSHNQEEVFPSPDVPPSAKLTNFEECKSRVNILLKYVSDAHFRYDVIRPAFYKNISLLHNKAAKENFVPHFGEGYEDTNNHMDINRDLVSTNSSDTDQKSQGQLSTSLISCMLASHTQLLCYTLIENSLENAVKIARLFQDDLKNSNELKELQLLDYFSELHTKICAVPSTFSDSSTLGRLLSENSSKFKIGEIAQLGIESSQIQSLVYEMLLKMDKVDNLTKKTFMIDYALSSSPSLKISQAILESIFIHNNNLLYQNNSTKKVFPEKVELFLVNFQRLISDLALSINTSQMSIADFLEKALPSSHSLDSQSFLKTLHFEEELKRAYCDFYMHLNYLENRIIDDPELLNSETASFDVFLHKDAQLLLTFFDKIVDHCPTGKFLYLKILLIYVRKVSKALVECKKRNLQATNKEGAIDASLLYSSSYFSILKQSPSAILCSMVIKSKIPPKIIDDMALIMKVNLIAVLCSVYCPSISTSFLLDCNLQFSVNELCNPCLYELIDFYSKRVDLHFEQKSIRSSFVNHFFADQANTSMGDSSFDQSFQPLINGEVLNYFNSKCTVLVELLRILNLINEEQIVNLSVQSLINMHITANSPLLKWVNRIKGNFFFGDTTSTVSLAFQPRIMSGHPAVIKTLEFCAANQNYLQIYNLFNFIVNDATQSDLKSPTIEGANSYQLLQNAIYTRLVFLQENVKFVFQIVRDPNMKCELMLKLLTESDRYDETFMATRLIRLCLQSIHQDEVTFGIDASECKRKLERFLCEIDFYAAVGQLTGLKTWKLSKDNLEGIDILTIIKSKKRYLMAIDWYTIKGLEKDTCDLHIELLIHAYSELNDYASFRKLFYSLVDQMQSTDVISIVEKTLNLVANLDLRSFLVDLLGNHYRKRSNYALVDHYEQYKLGIEMGKLLSHKIREDYIKLISAPFLMIEQLLMNCEIDSLDRIINQYKLIKADDLVEKFAQKSVYIEIYDSHSFNGSDLTLISSSLNDSSSTNRSSSLFVVPDKIPSKEQWVSDATETHCMICHIVRFSMINRRHHCRRCGRVVCHSCSSNSFLIPELNANVPVRVCHDCYLHLKQHTRKASTLSSHSSSSLNISNRRTNWFLYPDEDAANEARRMEFAYESAPSVTLCLAILKLHSDKRKCCKFIIDKICAPLLESTDSRNVDSTLLIEMIRSLLISTRISLEENLKSDNFSRKDKLNEIEQLNLYLDRLDVIRMMINSNYGTKEMIGYVLTNNIQKLQEKLLEMERFELAVDIAKKYGLDSSSIWKTWAIICLKHFHFADARRKFGRYFDQVTRLTDVQPTLKNIVDILVRSNCANLQQVSVKDKCAQIIAGKYDFLRDGTLQPPHSSQPSSVNPTLTSPIAQHHLKPRIFQEIVYYFKQYGSPEELLHFYVDHLYWKEAVEHYIAHNTDNPSGNFLTDIFIPAQMKCSLGSLFTAIRQCDPQLSHLWTSLIAICKYLAKNEFYNSLYRVQIFMSDYLRAAITQINCFFLSQTRDADTEPESVDLNSFDLLCRRVNHLEKARDNCNMYLHNIDFVKMKTGCLHVEKKDVLKQIRLIEMQIEVLKRFKLKKIAFPLTFLRDQTSLPLTQYLPLGVRFLQSMQTELSIKLSASLYPPTLLEHDVCRKSVITALIILYFCDNLEEGFRYSLRIIQDHQLDSRLVYKMAAVLLMSYELEKDSSASQILEQLSQLLVFVRSCSDYEGHHHLLAGDAEPGLSSPFTGRSMSISRSLSLSTPTPGASAVSVDPSVVQMRSRLCDDIVTSCIGAMKLVLDTLKHLPMEPSIGIERAKLSELSESLIKLLSDDKLRIEAYLHAGKLKLAYLLAVSLGQRSNVVRVLDTARQSNDQHYVKICEMWLKKNALSPDAS